MRDRQERVEKKGVEIVGGQSDRDNCVDNNDETNSHA